MKVRGQKGNILITLCVGLFLMGFVGGVYWFFAGSPATGDRKIASETGVSFAELRDRVKNSLDSPDTIKASVARNPNAFACLHSSTGDCSGKGGEFQLYQSSDPAEPPLSQLVRGNGLGLDGIGCTGYPSAECPLRVETSWQPVCGPTGCVGTKSMRVKTKVIYSAEGKPESWEDERMFTPDLVLSERVQCERNAMVWSGTACVSANEANPARAMASADGLQSDSTDRARDEMPVDQNQQQPENPFICPDQINVQGLAYTVEYLDPARAQVRVPAMNGCPAEDTFVFQCSAKSPANFPGEGQWIQVEASMAPACDQNGVPISPELRM